VYALVSWLEEIEVGYSDIAKLPHVTQSSNPSFKFV